MSYGIRKFEARGAAIERLSCEVAAAPTREDAGAILDAADWLFMDMLPRERERIYERIISAISEKP